MKFNLIIFYECSDVTVRNEIGLMSMQEIKEFAEMLEVETEEGFTTDELKFSIEEKSFHLYVS